MKKRVIKLMICVMLISCLLIGFSGVSYAALPNRTVMQRFNAWVASALVAANITIGSTVAPVQQVLDTLSYGADMPWTPSYTYSGPTWDDDIMDRSTIRIQPDIVTIDGVPYTDIWLSHDASQKFRVNAFDLESAWSIASNSNGTYASGVGTLYGVPMFTVTDQTGTYNRSQTYQSPANSIGFVGDKTFSSDFRSAQRSVYVTVTPDQYTSILGAGPAGSGDPSFIEVFYSNSSLLSPTGYYHLIGKCDNRPVASQVNMHNYPLGDLVSNPFEFDWVSGTVPAEQLPEDSGLHFLVPSSYTDSGSGGDVYNYDIHDLITLNPDIDDPGGYEFNFDPTLNPDFQLDLDTNEALGAIISAVIAAYLADIFDGDGVKIEYTVNEPAPPEPGVIDPLPDPDPAPDVPEPGTTIADTDWTKLDEILRWIQSTIDSIRHLTESLQTMLDSIIEGIRDIMQQIAEIPDAIRELADKILEDIELGPAKLFDKALDILKTLFLPLLLPIRAMMNLWHYVVEWIQSISTPFTWIFGIMSATSGNLVLPIYALLAGGICISIYKALGR